MIDLYTFVTPNGYKASIMLEEIGLDYTAHSIDITKDEQFAEDFLEISPNNKIPAIVDHDNGMKLMESGAILIYLADKTGKLLANQTEERYRTIEWLMWQMGGLGPMAGQAHHFAQFNPDVSEYAKNRYLTETQRLYGVLEKRLSQHEYIVDDYSIADIAIWPWVARFEWQRINLHDYPNILRWYQSIASRPAVIRGYQVPFAHSDIPMPK